ncbi:MAG TPA: BamA/TamA family outer membrane protein, partial [Flavitalea sp.]|nr:BamA/TamA family outer membrane protein [Flavitalea sp.]
YKNFSSAVDSILRMHPYCLRVAGHEHTLQMIELQNQFYIVSGAGSKMSSISKKKPSLLYASDKTGFAVIERNYNGNVYVRFFSSMNDTAQNPIYAKMLPSIDTTAVKVKPYTIPLLPDSITIAGRDYSAGKIKKLFLGSNYRKEWGASLRIPVFNIGKEYGGLNPNRRGGGMQTKSLRLVDKNGQEFVLRSIEKFPDNAIPEEFRETFIKDLVVDGISASYPYAALSIPILSEAAHVPHAKPRLVYVPDDPRFGFYQSEFKNSIAIFEEREPGRYGNNVGTEKVLENMIGDNDNRIDQRALVKARLLDLFIMDFDRHEDQWRWGNIDTGKGKVYFPIPRDRDQAFFVNEGIIPRQVRKPWFLPSIQGFRAKAHNIITFNYNARLFDRVFLNQATRKVWEDSTDALISEMTDDVIEKALRSQPPEIFAYSGPKIIETLKKRRNYLKKEAIEYYKYLAKEVEVTGSDKKEFFDILRKDDGTLDVTVHKINKEGKLAGTMYQRTFYQKETKEVQLFGMGGADSFRISGNDARGIKVRLIGGTGDDVFENVSHVSKKRNILYDLRSEDNVIKGTFRQELSFDPSVNQPNRNRKYVRYNLWHPTLAFTYNRDDGIFAGGSIRFTKQGFRKFPFKVEHRLSGTHALATKAYQFKYTMERISFFRNNDLLLSGLLRAPNYTLNFFGYGNESNYNKENSIRFYRTRFDQAEASIMLRNRVAEYVTVAAGPVYNFASVSRDDNEGRIVFHPAAVNLDSAHLYQDKNYLGAQGVITVDNRNDLIMPSRGVYWVTTYRNFGGLGQSSNKYSQLNSDMTVYISSNQPARFIFVVRFGAGWSYGKYEFFQAQTLSGTDNLRGYRRSRFAGDKVMFNNTEIRWRIKDFRTYLFPGTFGLLAFHDVGRVWLKGEHSSVWHTGYGGGFWLSPAHRSVLSVSYGISKEGGLPIISLGFQF